MSEKKLQVYEFGPFRLDPLEHILFRDGVAIDLTPKMFEVLLLLVSNSGHLLEREEIIRQVWPDTVVEENNLSQCIYMLRKVLGESQEGNASSSFIETVPRRGYRFTTPVRVQSIADEENPVNQAIVNATPSANAGLPTAQHYKRLAKWRVVLVAGAVLVIVMTATLMRELRAGGKQNAVRSAKSVAVLPFRMLTSTKKEDEYLSLGLADAIITKLSEAHGLLVRPVDEVQRYSGNDIDTLKAGRELAVSAVLEGTIQQDGEKVRVEMRLLDTKSGASLWADQIDSNLVDVFAIEDRVTDEVQRTLIPGLNPQVSKANLEPPPNVVTARQDYMKGRFFWSQRTNEGLTTAIQFFQQAIERDPNYAEAYAGIADAYALLGFYTYLPPAESYPKAKAAALRALSINENLADAHVSLLIVAVDYDWDWALAEKEFRAAIALNPNNAQAYQGHAYLYLALGKTDAAVQEAEKALQLDPLSPGNNNTLAWIYYLANDYPRALQQCQKTHELYPESIVVRQVASLVHTQTGEYQLALAELDEAKRIAPDVPITDLLHAQALAASGRHDESRRQLNELMQKYPSSIISAYYVAAAYSMMGDANDTFAWLDKAYATRSNWLIYLTIDPRFDHVRQDARFAPLVRKVGLPVKELQSELTTEPFRNGRTNPGC
jgi:DNA-binding winged helix-turn-helix (wHTH) protein/TolB-like protein/Flp pilus assembly protein TadD